ncbi:MAG: acyl-CoA dehydrogenase [Candidatus Binatia bacterium]|nr:MAG: acyl-CoA dehydrogenase [Candidatus Binatia bacterium]
MDFGLSQEQVLFRQTLRRFLEERCPTTRVRAIMESETGHDPDLWRELGELGLQGLAVPESRGGAGQELLDLALASEELGYACTPGPFLGSALASVALGAASDSFADLLSDIAAGRVLATVAFGEDGSEWDPEAWKTEVRRGRLSGEKPLVLYASEADVFVVGARDSEGPALWVALRSASGVRIDRLEGVDATRRVARVRFENTPAERIGGREAAERLLDAGSVLVAADAYGGARRCLDMTLRYVLEREQFGRPIGSFQAVKHQLADLATDLEPALSLWWYAAHAFDHIPEDASRHASLAKAHLSDLFDRTARTAVELHGGIGFTWEYDLHLWFRRAIFDRGFFGDAAFHRARVARLAGWSKRSA